MRRFQDAKGERRNVRWDHLMGSWRPLVAEDPLFLLSLKGLTINTASLASPLLLGASVNILCFYFVWKQSSLVPHCGFALNFHVHKTHIFFTGWFICYQKTCFLASQKVIICIVTLFIACFYFISSAWPNHSYGNFIYLLIWDKLYWYLLINKCLLVEFWLCKTEWDPVLFVMW